MVSLVPFHICTMYLNGFIYIYINLSIYMVRSLCFDFSVVQCSIRGSRARYVLRQGKKTNRLQRLDSSLGKYQAMQMDWRNQQLVKYLCKCNGSLSCGKYVVWLRCFSKAGHVIKVTLLSFSLNQIMGSHISVDL